MMKARKRTQKEKIGPKSTLSNVWGIENALERKKTIRLKNALYEWWKLENALERKKIGLESALSDRWGLKHTWIMSRILSLKTLLFLKSVRFVVFKILLSSFWWRSSSPSMTLFMDFLQRSECNLLWSIRMCCLFYLRNIGLISS